MRLDLTKHARLLGSTLLVLIALCAVGAGAGADTPAHPAKSPSADRSPQGNTTTRELTYIEQQKDMIKRKLRDPRSAQFRNVRVCYAMGPVVVGEVNSNNGFGGKSGFQRFVSGGKIQILEEEMEPGAMDKVLTSLCP